MCSLTFLFSRSIVLHVFLWCRPSLIPRSPARCPTHVPMLLSFPCSFETVYLRPTLTRGPNGSGNVDQQLSEP